MTGGKCNQPGHETNPPHRRWEHTIQTNRQENLRRENIKRWTELPQYSDFDSMQFQVQNASDIIYPYIHSTTLTLYRRISLFNQPFVLESVMFTCVVTETIWTEETNLSFVAKWRELFTPVFAWRERKHRRARARLFIPRVLSRHTDGLRKERAAEVYLSQE